MSKVWTQQKLFVVKMDVKSVLELQKILGSYGVTFSAQKKCNLISLCNLAVEVDLTVDPD